MSITVTIGVCTFRRAHIATTLASLSLLQLPLNTTLHILVVDNDDTPSAQVAVAAAAEKYGLEVTYLHAPACNISIARNACLEAARGEFFAFVDDDEIVTPGWLIALLDAQANTGADIILGPVNALYAEDAPYWLKYGAFHATRPVSNGGRITTGYAGNVLMKLSSPALSNLRFREDLGVTGGEDTDFFQRATDAGATIRYAEQAIIYEGVPPERANFKWLLRRRFRYGQTHARMLMEAGKPRTYHLLLAAAKMLVCYAMVIPTILFPIARRQWLLRGTLHLGVVNTLKNAKRA